MRSLLHKYRRSLNDYHAVLSYALLGIIGGLGSGLVVIAFNQSINYLSLLWSNGLGPEAFEQMPRWLAFALPASGAAILGLAFSLIPREDRETGIVHVLSRLHSHYGSLPIRNAVVQFLGGAFALASGQSGGREGPGVHLGGAVNSLLGQKLGLPNNSLRVLVACGTAGGIAAAFNTPLAGVIFAMEVIIAEYTVLGFLPVVLAAVSASAISRFLTGGAVLFSYSGAQLHSLWEIPFIVLLGIFCGIAMTVFIGIARFSARASHLPVFLRFSAAGLVTGSLALFLPEILGMGHDSLHRAIAGELAPTLLIAIALGKILATAVSSGVGMPIGVIGPSLLIGACIGGALGFAGHNALPQFSSDPSLYIVIGMAACMAAILNAPLAAILAVLEMTQSVHIAMPAMLAIVTATLIHTGVFRQRSAHQSALAQQQRNVPDDPLNQLLHRTAITASLEVSVVCTEVVLAPDRADLLIKAPPAWCLIERDSESLYLVEGRELANWLAEQVDQGSDDIDLTEAGIRRWTMAPVPSQATLRQALDTMRKETVEAVCVYNRSSDGKRVLQGVVTRKAIERFYLTNL